jgi:hypothetical protein
MPFQKGHTKSGGRKAGESKRESVAEICARMHCDPIEGMCRLATDPKVKPELRGRMHAELAQYLWPKLRAMELSGPGGSAIDLNVSGTELLSRRIDSLAARIAAPADPERPE